ncbi:MAG: hypothetical protein HUJ57_07725 [Erysipelotrichaceae bacterium]|nr:hypothetical protein [Erysipelotrichaceae bacterium]
MNIQIIYKTRTGHTRTLANAIGDVVGITPIDITEPHNLGEVDLLIVGTGIYNGKPDQALLNYLDNLPANRIPGAAIFSSSASGEDMTELIVNMLRSKGIEVYSKHFVCKGQRFWQARKHPNDRDIRKIQDFARKLIGAIRTE